MFKKVFFAGVSAMLMTACASDEAVINETPANAISFNVTSNGVSRSALLTSTNFEKFNVYAYLGTKTYIDGHIIAKAAGEWTDTNGLSFWPGSDALDFYAYSYAGTDAADVALNHNDGVPTITYEAPAASEDQGDLIIATAKGKTKTDAQVDLAFAHVLSQIAFKAACLSKNLHVEIEKIVVEGIAGSGTYSYETGWSLGAKDATSTTPEDLHFAIDETAAAIESESYEADDCKMMVLPQPIGKDDTSVAVKVYYSLWNVAGEEFDDTTDIKLIDMKDTDPATLKFKAGSAWTASHRYTYTIKFADPAAGSDPNNPGEGPDGEGTGVVIPGDVTVPITYSVSVSEFTDGGETIL